MDPRWEEISVVRYYECQGPHQHVVHARVPLKDSAIMYMLSYPASTEDAAFVYVPVVLHEAVELEKEGGLLLTAIMCPKEPGVTCIFKVAWQVRIFHVDGCRPSRAFRAAQSTFSGSKIRQLSKLCCCLEDVDYASHHPPEQIEPGEVMSVCIPFYNSNTNLLPVTFSQQILDTESNFLITARSYAKQGLQVKECRHCNDNASEREHISVSLVNNSDRSITLGPNILQLVLDPSSFWILYHSPFSPSLVC